MTRVRIIYQIGPTVITGKLALNQVMKVCASYGCKAVPVPGQPLWKIAKEMVTLTQRAGYDIGRFMVYRESRHVKLQRSPYKQMLRTLFGRAKLQPPVQRINTQAQAHPKLNKLRSRTVKLLEQELMLQD